MSTSPDPTAREEQFNRLLSLLDSDAPAVTTSTMMGLPCLRLDGTFFASLQPATGELILKLPAARVADLVADSTGHPFAPNGRVFTEWIAVPAVTSPRSAELMREAIQFARDRTG